MIIKFIFIYLVVVILREYFIQPNYLGCGDNKGLDIVIAVNIIMFMFALFLLLLLILL